MIGAPNRLTPAVPLPVPYPASQSVISPEQNLAATDEQAAQLTPTAGNATLSTQSETLLGHPLEMWINILSYCPFETWASIFAVSRAGATTANGALYKLFHAKSPEEQSTLHKLLFSEGAKDNFAQNPSFRQLMNHTLSYFYTRGPVIEAADGLFLKKNKPKTGRDLLTLLNLPIPPSSTSESPTEVIDWDKALTEAQKDYCFNNLAWFMTQPQAPKPEFFLRLSDTNIKDGFAGPAAAAEEDIFDGMEDLADADPAAIANPAAVANPANAANLANLAEDADDDIFADIGELADVANAANLANLAEDADDDIFAGIGEPANVANVANVANAANVNNAIDRNNILESRMFINARNKSGRPLYEKPVIQWMVVNNEWDLFEKALATGMDIDELDQQWKTPLHWAVEIRDEAAVRKLIKHGANTELKDKMGRLPIVRAILIGDTAIFKCFVETGGQNRDLLLQQTFLDYSLLHLAAQEDRLDIVKCLINECRAEIALPAGNEQATPIRLAAERGNFDIVEFLAECGAQGDQKALRLALDNIRTGTNHLRVAKFLAKHIGAAAILDTACAEEDIKIIKLLIQHAAEEIGEAFASVTAASTEGMDFWIECLERLLCAAANEGQIPMAEFLINNNVEQIDRGVFSMALELALHKKRWDFAEFLIDAAKEVKHWDMAEPLIDAGTEENQLDGLSSLLKFNISPEKLDIVEFLVNKGAKLDWVIDENSPISLAMDNNDKEMVQFFVKEGASINLLHGEWTLLERAIILDGKEAIFEILATSDQFNQSIDNEERTALLHMAIEYNRHAIAEFLESLNPV